MRFNLIYVITLFSSALKVYIWYFRIEQQRLHFDRYLFKKMNYKLISMMKTKFVFCSVIILILTACIVSTGCTSTQSPAQTSPVTMVSTPSQPESPTTLPATAVVSLAPTTAPVVSAKPTPQNSGISVTVNSATKKTELATVNPANGAVFLVLDVTIQNANKDFPYTSSSFQILANNAGSSWHSPLTTKFASGLDNQLMSGTVPANSKTTGQIVFGVSGQSNTYQFSVRDPSGKELAKVENIKVS